MADVRRALARGVLAFHRQRVRARDKAFSLASARAYAGFGRRTVLQLPLRVDGEDRIEIGDDVFIGAGSWLHAGEAESPIALRIGAGTNVTGDCVLAAVRSVTLGRDVLLARGVYVADHSHAFDDPLTPVLAQGVSRIAPVEIGDGAWLGQHVVVCPGVRIGRGAVIGANSVVTRDVPDFAVAVGAPARVIRERQPIASAA